MCFSGDFSRLQSSNVSGVCAELSGAQRSSAELINFQHVALAGHCMAQRRFGASADAKRVRLTQFYTCFMFIL